MGYTYFFIGALVALITVIPHLACDTNDLKNGIAAKSDSVNNQFKEFTGQAVHIEVEPTGEYAQVFYNIDPASCKNKPIMLKKTVHISGRVEPPQMLPRPIIDDLNHDKADAFADILAIPTVNRISFLSPRIPTMKSRLQSNAGFGIDLLSGLSYTLILNPSGLNNRAPIHLDAGVVQSDDQLNFLLDADPNKIFGTVVFDEANDVSDVVRARMRARLMLGSRLISSINEIDKSGKFSLAVSQPLFRDAENQPLNLFIEPVDQETALPRIRHKLDIDMIKNDFDVGNISVGTIKKPIATTFEVRGADDTVIGNAILYLRASIGSGTAVVTKQVNKVGSTKFTNLYEGNYDIAIIPPVDSRFAMRVIKDVEIEAKDNMQFSFYLEKREALTAHVQSQLGQPVSGALIQFSRIGEIGNFATEDIYDDNLFKLTATTNEDGKVCSRKFGFSTADKNECSALLLDEGRYLAHIIPPAGRELAHKWVTFDFPDKNELNLTLDKPEILHGQIMRDDGKTPAAHAFVTVYLSETISHNQPKIIGNAITDDKGYFRAFVSAP